MEQVHSASRGDRAAAIFGILQGKHELSMLVLAGMSRAVADLGDVFL